MKCSDAASGAFLFAHSVNKPVDKKKTKPRERQEKSRHGRPICSFARIDGQSAEPRTDGVAGVEGYLSE